MLVLSNILYLRACSFFAWGRGHGEVRDCANAKVRELREGKTHGEEILLCYGIMSHHMRKSST